MSIEWRGDDEEDEFKGANDEPPEYLDEDPNYGYLSERHKFDASKQEPTPPREYPKIPMRRFYDDNLAGHINLYVTQFGYPPTVKYTELTSTVLYWGGVVEYGYNIRDGLLRYSLKESQRLAGID